MPRRRGIPLLELVRNIDEREKITTIQNLWIKIDNTIYKNEIRNLVENIDDICFPDRTIFDKYYNYRTIKNTKKKLK
jgi:hypothetical protein